MIESYDGGGGSTGTSVTGAVGGPVCSVAVDDFGSYSLSRVPNCCTAPGRRGHPTGVARDVSVLKSFFLPQPDAP
ncbi:unnamed protein product [Echinostoma caproni]|uniref:Uncharacterized protein n=1 Tax=Echinostoma caproni TaxID=27848 RepID=A0A183AJV9_9TREM|nr:unnamed protein product [Echinostoma caproni]